VLVGQVGFVMDGEVTGNGSERALNRRLIASIIAAILILTTVASVIVIVPQTASAQAPARSLRVGVGEDNLQVTTTNPLRITLLYEYVIVYNVYSTLLTYDRAYSLVGDLAYDWSVAPDNKTWTFRLVDNAYFTNPANPSDQGQPVTADDVVFTFTMMKSLSSHTYSSYLTNVSAVNKVDALTVEIVLDEPLGIITSVASVIPILPQYIWGLVQNPLNYQNRPPIGSGATYYDTASTTLPAVLVLRRNPNFYGDKWYCQFSRPDEVRYLSYPDSTTLVTDFLSGANDLDIIDHIAPPDYVGSALASYSPKWAVDTGFVGEISVNVITPEIRAAFPQFQQGNPTSSPLLLDQTVRTAIAMSINKTALVERALLGLGKPADTLVPSSNPWHYDVPANEEFVFDTAAARAVLNAAGWTYDSAGNLNPAATPLYKAGGTEPLIIRFYTLNTAKQWEIAAQNIVAWLAETGIQTTDRLGNTNPGFGLYSINQMGTYWYSGDYDVWLWDWIFTPYSDPSLDVLSVETTMEIGDFSDNYYSNQTFDALYNQSLRVLDPTARRAITDEMQRMVYDFASYILPYYRLDLYAANPNRAWTNFGDWETYAGLIDDSDLPALFYQVSPLDNPAPVISSIPPVQWVEDNPASISVAASDANDASLTYIWDFGDSSPGQTTTAGSVPHTYANPGTYTVKVRVKDAEWPVCAETTATILPAGAGNLPPQPTGLQFPQTAEPGTSVTFTFTVSDSEGDPVEVTWDWGDNSATETQTVTGTSSPQTVTRSHTYADEGTFTVTATVTDNEVGIGNHVVPVEGEILIERVTQPPPTPQFNPLIDYGIPLLIVAVILIAVAAVVMRRRKARQKEEQQREEPGAPPPSPPPPP